MYIKYIKNNRYKNLFFIFFYNTLQKLYGNISAKDKKNVTFFRIRIFFVDKTTFNFHSSNKINPLSANLTKWSKTLKQFVGNFPTNCLSVFEHFVGLALKGLMVLLLLNMVPQYFIVISSKTLVLTEGE